MAPGFAVTATTTAWTEPFVIIRITSGNATSTAGPGQDYFEPWVGEVREEVEAFATASQRRQAELLRWTRAALAIARQSARARRLGPAPAEPAPRRPTRTCGASSSYSARFW